VPRDLNSAPFDTVESAVEAIDDAIHGEDHVRLQKTHLDLLKKYLNKDNQKTGRLVIVDPVADSRASKTVTFCKVSGERYVIPWISDESFELLVNRESYLSYREEANSAKPTRVYFDNAEELFFGDVKAFMILEADRVE
jgi:hypothetical protein